MRGIFNIIGLLLFFGLSLLFGIGLFLVPLWMILVLPGSAKRKLKAREKLATMLMQGEFYRRGRHPEAAFRSVFTAYALGRDG